MINTMTTKRTTLPPQGIRTPRGRRGGYPVPVPPSSSSCDGPSRACHAGALDERATAEGDLWAEALRTIRVLLTLLEEIRGRSAQAPNSGGKCPGGKGGLPSYSSIARKGSAPNVRSVGTQTQRREGLMPEKKVEKGGEVTPPPRCFKCLLRGHEKWRCPLAVDRSNCCLHCGGAGHQARVCSQRRASCPACKEAGKDAAHRIGGRTCPIVPPRGRRRRRKKRGKGGTDPPLEPVRGGPDVGGIVPPLLPPAVGVEKEGGACPPPSPSAMEVEEEGGTCPSLSPPVMEVEEKGGTRPPLPPPVAGVVTDDEGEANPSPPPVPIMGMVVEEVVGINSPPLEIQVKEKEEETPLKPSPAEKEVRTKSPPPKKRKEEDAGPALPSGGSWDPLQTDFFREFEVEVMCFHENSLGMMDACEGILREMSLPKTHRPDLWGANLEEERGVILQFLFRGPPTGPTELRKRAVGFLRKLRELIALKTVCTEACPQGINWGEVDLQTSVQNRAEGSRMLCTRFPRPEWPPPTRERDLKALMAKQDNPLFRGQLCSLTGVGDAEVPGSRGIGSRLLRRGRSPKA
ncbi:uncharacterized protein [Linepithema humile]|uniref:uncharacterized protein n=1 Tax=Linepithema humile TaxID=83485 RepID=UPI00351E1B9F